MSDLAEKLSARLVPTDSGCLEFHLLSGALPGGDGYGQLYDMPRRRVSTHVLAWEIVNGPVPLGMYVCHSCDNPPCCNIEHLFLGTNKDNLQDMCRKGRHGVYVPTHCPQGHEYTEHNSVRRPSTGLKCRVCLNERKRKANV